LTALLREQGADVIDLPTIDIRPLRMTPALSSVLASLNRPGWLLFSSRNAVELFMEQLFDSGRDLRSLSGWKIGAVGKATADVLKEKGLIADLVPAVSSGKHLGEALRPLIRTGERVVSLESVRSAGGAASALADMRIELVRVQLYDTVSASPPDPAGKEDLLRQLFEHQIPLVTFSSASMAENLAAMLGCTDFTGVPAVCIGSQTAAAAGRLGFSVITAEEASMDAMLRRIQAFFTN
ncbi:MAG: uroporphyrinogen-III synthase, partial [Oscillospiraceae bacterium]|nr:uroporphyrinogen-III synthase [Oscillospiraceae bacterium]